MTYFSENQILEYLDTMATRGIIPKNTVDAQKAAVTKMLSALSDDEKQRLDENLDIENLYIRFMNLAKNDLTPNSMKTYKGRFKTAFIGYQQWIRNPGSYSPKTRGRPKNKTADNIKESNTSPVSSNTSLQSPVLKGCKFIVPISPDVFAHLELPNKLTQTEASRINEFVIACTKSLIFEDA